MTGRGNLKIPGVVRKMNKADHLVGGARFENLIFIPLGETGESTKFRPFGSKDDKALLSRLQEAVSIEISKKEFYELNQLTSMFGTDRPCIPVPIVEQNHLCRNLLRAESFLFNEKSIQPGQPVMNFNFFKKELPNLNAEQLQSHIKEVVNDYLFCARISFSGKNHWLKRIKEGYQKNAFIELANSKNDIVEAVERMNKSSLLAVLKYPEDISYWRHRVGIVMRPYRAIPKEWRWKICSHDKKIFPHADSCTITCRCETCFFTVIYDVGKDELYLPEEVNLFQAEKRIATIERQFNQIASQNEHITENIEVLRKFKIVTGSYKETIESIIAIQNTLPDEVDVPTHPLIMCYKAMLQVEIPNKEHESMLLWMSDVEIPDVSLFKKIDQWQKLIENDFSKELDDLQFHLINLSKLYGPRPTDTVVQIKKYKLTREMAEKIDQFSEAAEDIMTIHILVKMLKGQATNKIRSLHLHEVDLFGSLASWPEKYITKAMIKLKKEH